MDMSTEYKTMDQQPIKCCCLPAKTALKLQAGVSMIYLIGVTSIELMLLKGDTFILLPTEAVWPLAILILVLAYNMYASVQWLNEDNDSTRSRLSHAILTSSIFSMIFCIPIQLFLMFAYFMISIDSPTGVSSKDMLDGLITEAIIVVLNAVFLMTYCVARKYSKIEESG